MKIGLVLSGGGARGAYEVGVLRFVRETLAKRIGPSVRFDIYCGTSVGAINACYQAATSDNSVDGIRSLVRCMSSSSSMV